MDDRPRIEEEAAGSAEMRDCIANFRRRSRNRGLDDEIAELEAELRQAYIAKELQVQLGEKETERYIEKMRQRQAVKMMRQEKQAALEMDICRRTEILRKSEDYRRQLTEQITRKQEERGAMMEEDRREREILTEVDRIREQSEKYTGMRMKRELAESVNRERSILEKMKQIHNEEQMEVEAKKLANDREYLQELDRRTEEAKQLRVEQIQSRERAMHEIAKILTSATTEREKRMALVGEIIAEDVKRELSIKEKEEIVRREKMRDDLVANLEEQIVFTEQCKLRFVEQDRAFAEEIMKKIMEDEKTAKLTAQAKRRMQLQYREDLTGMIEERQKIREVEIAKVEEEARKEYMLKMVDLRRVTQEKKRLLEKHALNVVGFLDEHTLSHEEKDIMTKAFEEKSAQ
ncbi:meiosis-specific nuclear structural protein 1-like [Lasioglossum baleicum]|uniref:meiosis-specific nuclear structural protein 1-like n=1 Tax=Lasioglossum baleicum TaxID=434251 RepID=UPI003FCD02E7